MVVKKCKVCSRLWKFVVIKGTKKTVVAITKKRLDYPTTLYGNIKKKKKTILYSLGWDINGLRKVMKKTEMKGIITGSEYFPSDFTNYSQSNEKFSSKYIKKTISKALKDYIKRKNLYEEQRIDI